MATCRCYLTTRDVAGQLVTPAPAAGSAAPPVGGLARLLPGARTRLASTFGGRDLTAVEPCRCTSRELWARRTGRDPPYGRRADRRAPWRHYVLYRPCVPTIWIARLLVSPATAAKLSARHGLSADEVRDALTCVPGLQFRWDRHPARGRRAIVRVVIRQQAVSWSCIPWIIPRQACGGLAAPTHVGGVVVRYEHERLSTR